MMFSARLFRGALLLIACALLSGCIPSGSGPLDEEKEPHFLAGKNRISTLDYKGAIESFEKALQANPQSASAHFELACLFEKTEMEPAAAIYHYEHYLKLRKDAGNADLVKQHIMACKQALAETVSLGPVTEKVQRQFEQIAEESKRLTEENKRLREDLDRWSSYAARLQTLTNQSTTPVRGTQPNPIVRAPAPALAQAASAGSSGTASAPSTLARTHTVKAGETPILIAKKYSVKLEALLAANPNLDARRLRVGQILRIPGS